MGKQTIRLGLAALLMSATPLVHGAQSLPYADSFAGASFDAGGWTVQKLSSADSYQWEPRSSSTYPTCSPQDNDGGLAYYYSYASSSRNCGCRLFTPELSAEGLQNAYVSYWFCHYSLGNDQFYVEVKVGEGDWTEVANSRITVKNDQTGWKHYELNISDYIENAQTFQVSFTNLSAAGYNTVFDNVMIYEKPAYDLSVSASAPAKVLVGNSVPLNISVYNNGANDVAGSDYTVGVYEGETLIATCNGEDIASGETKTITYDSDAISSNKTYHVVVNLDSDANAENNVSENIVVEVVDSTTPNPVTNVAVSEATGGVQVEWTAPTEGTDGVGFNPAILKYNVYRVISYNPELVGENVSGTSFFDAYVPDDVVTVFYRVVAVLGENASQSANSPEITIGTISLPFEYSFAGGSLGKYFSSEDLTSCGYKWEAKSSGTLSACKPVDEDGGLCEYNSSTARSGNKSRLSTVSITRGDETNPTISFYLYNSTNYSSSNDYVHIEVSKDGGEWTKVDGSEVYRYTGDTGWSKHEISLAAAVKDCEKYRIAIIANSMYGYYLTIDDVRIFNKADKDLELKSLTADAKVMRGTDITFTAKVANNGIYDVEEGAYSVSVKKGETVVATAVGVVLAKDATAELVLTVPATDVADTETFYAVVTYADDQVANNNVSEEVTVMFADSDTPLPVTDINVTSGAEAYTVSWTPVCKGVNGYIFNASNLRYDVTRIVGDTRTPVATGIAETSCTDSYVPESLVTIRYEVVAKIGDNASEAALSDEVRGGSVSLPFADSFAGGSAFSELWTVEGSGSNVWQVKSSSTSPSASPQDEDGGFAWFNSYNISSGNSSRLITAPISKASSSNPFVSFYMCHSTSGNDKLYLEISANGGEWTKVEGSELTVNHSPSGWAYYEFPISSYIQDCDVYSVSFTALSAYGHNTVIDNVRIFNKAEYDLEAVSFTGPLSVVAGNEAEYKLKVKNNGGSAVAADDYSISVKLDGEDYKNIPGEELAPGATTEFSFSVNVDAAMAADAPKVYSASLIYDADLIPENNDFEEVHSLYSVVEKPGVKNLTASLNDDETVALAWESPIDMTGYTPVEITESFEDFDKGAEGPYNGWTVLDNDAENTPTSWYGFQSDKIVVANPSGTYAPTAPDGKNYLGVGHASCSFTQDDWLISPEINCFPASSLNYSFWFTANSSTTCKFEVLYSTTDAEPESFTNVIAEESYYKSEIKFVQYSYSGIPSNAKYIALHMVNDGSKSVSAFFDKFSITDSMEPVVGFNVYEDGVRINDEIVSADVTSYTAPASDKLGSRGFTVTAVYADGESAMCDEVRVGDDYIDIYWDNTSASWETPVVMAGGQKYVMTRLAEVPAEAMSAPAREADYTGLDEKVEDYNCFRATIPANTTSVTFLDDADDTNNVTFENPEHNTIYNETGAVGTYPDDVSTGIFNILNDDDADAVYFNMQGVRIAKPAPGEICIKVVGNRSIKVRF